MKFSVLLFSTVYLVMLVAGLVLWGAATATGARENVEKFIGELVASEDFRILGPTMLRASVVGGFVLVVLGTGANVLLAVVYNLISDVVGGVMVVFEERPGRARGGSPVQGAEPAGPLQPSRARAGRATTTRPDTTSVAGPRQVEAPLHGRAPVREDL
jgi:membrane-associated protease RseP (regulator of RpoE activity)